MGTQISLKLSDKMFDSAKDYSEEYGYDSIQDFIREVVREKLFEKEEMSGKLTSILSQKSLAKAWLSDEEDKAWAHLQEET